VNDPNPYDPPSEPLIPNGAVRSVVDPGTSLRFGGFLGIVSLGAALSFVCWMLLLSPGVSSFVLFVGGLIASPYMLIWLACRNMRFWLARLVIGITLAGCCGLSIYAFDFVDEDAQGALAIIFTPFYQLLAALILLLLAFIIERVWLWYSARTLTLKHDNL
jgi:hypothetical protein